MTIGANTDEEMPVERLKEKFKFAWTTIFGFFSILFSLGVMRLDEKSICYILLFHFNKLIFHLFNHFCYFT